MALLFVMTPDIAEKVYEAFIMAEALSENERLAILRKFVDSGEVTAFNAPASKEEIVRQLAHHFNVYTINRRQRGAA